VVPPGHKLRLGPFDTSVWETQRRKEPAGALLRSVAVSPGRVSAPTSVIRSPAEFSKQPVVGRRKTRGENNRHTPEQIVRKLRKAEAKLAAGASISEVARESVTALS
jgi:hypothetical protein